MTPMAASELSDADAVALRLLELEDREADVEHRLSELLTAHEHSPDEVTERQIAELRSEHLGIRRELNTVRARLVPLDLAARR